MSIILLASFATNHSPGVTAGLIAATALLGAVEAARTRRVPREAWLLLLPFGYWALSFALTRESWSVFFSMDFLRRDGAMLVSLVPMAALAALPLDGRRMMAALLLYLAFQAAVAVVGGVSALGGWHSAFYHVADVVDQKPTFFGLYHAHNATASVYALLALGAFAWAVRPNIEGRFRATLLVLAALLALGCILARSRGAFIGLGAGALFIGIQAVRRGVPRRVLVGAIAGLALAVGVGGGLLFPRFVKMMKGDTDQFRRELWGRAWQDFRRSPVVGAGFGRFNDQHREFSSMGVATRAFVFNDDYHAHNSYLHWLAEGGALGLAVMIAFWVLAALGIRGDDPLRDWILAGLVALVFLSLTEHYAGGGVFLAHLALLIGIRQSGGLRSLVPGSSSVSGPPSRGTVDR